MKKIVLIIAIVTLVLLTFTPTVNIGNVTINGIDEEQQEIGQWLKTQNWLWRSSNWLAENIPNREQYSVVTVTKHFPFAVEVNVIARDAFVAVQSGGYYVIIDMQGVVLALSNNADAPYSIRGFKVISAKVGNPLVSEDIRLIERAVQIVYLFQTYTSYAPDVMLKDGQIIQQMSDEIWINFGWAEKLEVQFPSAIAAYENMIEKSGSSGIVNVSNPNQCIVEPLKR